MTPAKKKAKTPATRSETQKAIDLVQLKAAVHAALALAPDMPLTTAEAGAYADVAPGTLTIWRNQGPGHGPEFIPGPRPRYTKAALDRFLLGRPARKGSPRAGRPPGRRRAVRP
jgi:hypothetical protein